VAELDADERAVWRLVLSEGMLAARAPAVLPILGLAVTGVMTIFLEATTWRIGGLIVASGLLVWRLRSKG